LIPAVSVLGVDHTATGDDGAARHAASTGCALMPRRLVEGSDPCKRGSGAGGRNVVTRARTPWTAAIGIIIVAALLYPGVQFEPERGTGEGQPGRRACDRRPQQPSTMPVCRQGSTSPSRVLVEGNPTASTAGPHHAATRHGQGKSRVAVAPKAWRRNGSRGGWRPIPAADGGREGDEEHRFRSAAPGAAGDPIGHRGYA